MSDPSNYTPGYSFSGYQAANPAKPLPAPQVDNELANVSSAVGGVITALKDVRRSDGKLKNGLVTADALDPDLTASFSGGAISAWAGIVDYAAGISAQLNAPATVVVYAGETYVCIVDHVTTSTFDPAKWKKIAAKGAAGPGSGDMLAANNLSELTNKPQARANLGLGALATATTVGTADIVDASITTVKLASNVVTPAKLNVGIWTAVASAATVDLGAQATRNIILTGTTTISSFGSTTVADNTQFTIRAGGAFTLVNSATLVLLGGADIAVEAGDMMTVVSDQPGYWRMVGFSRAAATTDTRKVGTAANNVVALDASAKLPAVDGSQLTGLIKDGSTATTTSGTSKALGGIPSTARRVTLTLNGVSTNGTSGIDIRAGSGGLASSGYAGNGGVLVDTLSVVMSLVTTGAYIYTNNAAYVISGTATFTKISGNTWTIYFIGATHSVARLLIASSIVTLAGALDTVGIATNNGTDAFDAGSIAMTWE